MAILRSVPVNTPSAMQLCVPLLFLLGAGAMPAHADSQHAVNAPAQPAATSLALDRSGRLDPHEVLERWQLISWDDFAPPKPGAKGAIAASASRLVFGTLAGGFGAGSDIADTKPLIIDAEDDGASAVPEAERPAPVE